MTVGDPISSFGLEEEDSRGAGFAAVGSGDQRDVFETSSTFESLGVCIDLVKALADQGIVVAFPIQALTIGDALAGHDVCGKAKTGAGKTLAFGLPLLQRVAEQKAGTPRTSRLSSKPCAQPRGLVLLPTRELALQVHNVLVPLSRAVGLRLVALYGGADVERQISRLRKGVDVVIATPGRLIDLVERNEVSLEQVSIAVLDEADRMADMGFMPQVEWLLRRMDRGGRDSSRNRSVVGHPTEGSRRQTLLFSATLDGAVDRLVDRYMNHPKFHEVASASQTVVAMEHRFLQVHELDKVKVVAAICRPRSRSLVFVRTKRGVDRLVRELLREGVKSAAIHGDLRQAERERSLEAFATGKLPVLVATDVAARGLDIENVDVVVHFDPPEDHKTYLHRSGRTARAGEPGLAVTLLLWNQLLHGELLQRRLGLDIPIVEMFSNDPRLADLANWQPAADESVL